MKSKPKSLEEAEPKKKAEETGGRKLNNQGKSGVIKKLTGDNTKRSYTIIRGEKEGRPFHIAQTKLCS